MGRLIYAGIGSVDGFIADANGEFAWSAPSEEVHSLLNTRHPALRQRRALRAGRGDPEGHGLRKRGPS